MSTEIDFQNGFICGMATKGLIRSGELYKPLIYNDSGIYSYFYIDFRRAVEDFSTGMWNESVVIHDSEQIKATGVELISTGVYKIICDISDRPHGITVMNKKTTRLHFSSGETVPTFSVHMFISGQPQYIDAGYFYDKLNLPIDFTSTDEAVDIDFWENIPDYEFPVETADFSTLVSSANETVSIVLT